MEAAYVIWMRAEINGPNIPCRTDALAPFHLAGPADQAQKSLDVPARVELAGEMTLAEVQLFAVDRVCDVYGFYMRRFTASAAS